MRRYAGIILTVLVFATSLAWLARSVRVGAGGEDAPPFHVDEAHKLGEAFYYHLFFELRDTDHPAWTGDFYARTNPPVAKYVFGAVLAAVGHPVRDQQLQADFDAHWREPEELRRHVDDDMLRIARSTSIVFGAGICALLFIIGRRAAGTAAGLIAVALLLGTRSFVQCAERGLTDTILMFHLALIVPVTMGSVGFLRRYWQAPPSGGAVRRTSILILVSVLAPGLAIALAAGSKLNGALTGPAYAAGLFLAAVLSTGSQTIWRRLALVSVVTVLAAVVAMGAFVAVNPYLYHDPVTRIADMLNAWGDYLVKQQLDPGSGLFTLHQKITAVGYASLHEETLLLSGLLEPLGLGMVGTWLTVLGFSCGLVYLGGRCFSHSRAAQEPCGRPPAERPCCLSEAAHEQTRVDAAVVMCWVVFIGAGITMWLPLYWDRHFLPSHLGICLVTAIGLAALPGGIRAVAAWIAGRAGARGGARVITGVFIVAGLWIILTFTAWVIKPTLLPDASAWSDPSAVGTQAQSPLFRLHAGQLFLELGRHDWAAEHFEAALALLDGECEARAATRIQRCSILRGLAHARVAGGDHAGGAEAFQQHVAHLESIRDGMKSADPYVREAFNAIIAHSQAEFARAAVP